MSVTRLRRATEHNSRISRIVLTLLLTALLSGCAVSHGRLLIDDAGGKLEQAAVETAAAPLMARGADVAVIIVAGGDDSGADFRQRLDRLGLLESGQIAPQSLALYVSFDPRYSELSAGGNWSRKLPDATLRAIRLTSLNPALRSSQFTQGVVNSLAALDNGLSRVTLFDRVAIGFRWLSLAVFAGMVVWLISLTTLGEWISETWRRSPAGRLAGWLWDQTPAGQRRLQRLIKAERQRTEDRAEFARSWCQGLSASSGTAERKALNDRLKLLDQQRKRLQQLPAGRKLLKGLEQLASDYTTLGHEASRLAPPPSAKKKTRSARHNATTGAAAIADSSWSSDSSWSTDNSSTSSSSSSDWSSDSPSGSSSPSSDGGSW